MIINNHLKGEIFISFKYQQSVIQQAFICKQFPHYVIQYTLQLFPEFLFVLLKMQFVTGLNGFTSSNALVSCSFACCGPFSPRVGVSFTCKTKISFSQPPGGPGGKTNTQRLFDPHIKEKAETSIRLVLIPTHHIPTFWHVFYPEPSPPDAKSLPHKGLDPVHPLVTHRVCVTLVTFRHKTLCLNENNTRLCFRKDRRRLVKFRKENVVKSRLRLRPGPGNDL